MNSNQGHWQTWKTGWTVMNPRSFKGEGFSVIMAKIWAPSSGGPADNLISRVGGLKLSLGNNMTIGRKANICSPTSPSFHPSPKTQERMVKYRDLPKSKKYLTMAGQFSLSLHFKVSRY